MKLSSIVASFLLLLPQASTEALPALDSCWRRCFTPKLACKDGDCPCFCRKARQTSLITDTIACIRQTCAGDRPFDPTALLTPFTENCRKPIPSDVLANANAQAAQAAQATASSDTSASLSKNAGDIPALRLAATTTSAKANVITTTYIGIATNANGEQETFTVPALVGLTGTIYGSPVTKIEGTATPTNVVTLPWPTLPVGYFFSTSRSGVITKPPTSATPSLGPNVGVTTRTTAIPVGTSGATSPDSGDAGEGGTVLEVSEGTRQGAKSSLGLMVVLLVGVMWF
ncbi:MAG: hypothetical protein L6R42_002243 [Xanthoria sp. 1 TBL-2021]|nr:MAG: hypothetical protein L6R42_002243 [Xanthoria sp. 1 TBL-2021]